jgi:hypothetical protein
MRIIFRLVEFGPGVNHYNPMLGNEIYPFMLDAFPMLLAFVALNVMHPGYVLQGPDSEFPRLTRAEKKAMKKQKKDDKRQRKEEKQQRKAAKKGGSAGKYAKTEDIGLEDTWGRTDGERERSHLPQQVDWSRANNV